MEFTQMSPRTRKDFTVEEASGPGTPPYAAVARFETASGTVYKVLADSVGDLYAEDEATPGTWTQINIFSGKGLVFDITGAVVTMCDVGNQPNNPEKWGYGVGIMAQAGDGFHRTDGTGWDTVSTQTDTTITLTGAYSAGGAAATYEIRRRLTIQSDKQVVLYPFKNILWISDQLGRMLFWDGTTFGEVVCFLNPRDDTEAITEVAVAGALPAGKYCYRAIFVSETGAFCPPSPELDIGSEFFSITVGASKKVVLTKKIYAQGFPSWVKKVILFRTIVAGDTTTRYRCTRQKDRYLKCRWSVRTVTEAPFFIWRRIEVKPAYDVFYCKQTSSDACEDRRELPDPQFFHVGTFDLDGTAIEDETLDEAIQQNIMWAEWGVHTHPDTYAPADWTELPTYIQKVLWLTDYAARLFCVSGDNTDEVRYSGRPVVYSETGGADEPGWWFPQNARMAGRDDAMQIRAGFELAGRFYVAKDSAIFMLDTRSADPMNWALVPTADNVGAASGRCVLTTTKHAYMLGHVQGEARMFVFDGYQGKDISDAVRTTLGLLTIDTDAGRAAIDSVAWEEYLIFSAAQSPTAPAVPSRTQVVVDRRTGAWTVWDAPIKRFSKGVPHPSKLLCVKTDDEAKVHSFLNGWGAITSFFVTKAYEFTKGHVWKVYSGFWADVYSESGLVQEDDHADLGMVAWTGSGGGGGGLVKQKDGTHIPVDERKQLWRPLPLNTAGDFLQLKFEIYKLAKDFSVRRLIQQYEPKPGRRPKQ
jgi:hypothetical protein